MTEWAPPGAEEHQLLGQLVRAPLRAGHSSTLDIADRLVAAGQAMCWTDGAGITWLEISRAGMERLGRVGGGAVLAFHQPRFLRMLNDLGLEPGSVLPTAEHALYDDIGRRALTPPLGNQTLCEGLASAIKLAALLPGGGEQ